ncbi:MAG: AAA family ATPase [Candidatus Brocadiae bacterium]|nr:AAA family ATPase [Candidatus Brocadiia bacterium]
MAAPSSERRTVAVLFSDLSGFTGMAQKMDPEEVQELVNALFLRLRGAVELQGGAVDKFIGDAVMAVFGAPVAHGDDGSRAVRAGLAMQRHTEEFSRERGLALRLRVGINLGEVMWGAVGGGAPTAMGDAVNLAQRLESAARPGTVLVSRAVERAARRDVRFRDVGWIEVKGRDEPVEAFEALENLPGNTVYRGVPGVASAMVGRGGELDRLLAPLDAGRGACFLVEGEAGIGKSRLLAELRRGVSHRHPGAWVAVGRSHEGVPAPLGAFGEMVRDGLPRGADMHGHLCALFSTVGASTPTDHENWADLIALSLGSPRAGARVAAIEPERRGVETVQAWRRWIAARAAGRPALLCLEDLHWADPGTRELLEDLAADPPVPKLLLVAATRPGTPRPAGFEHVPLQDLDAAGVRLLAAAVLEAPPDEALAQFVHVQTGGHPYYVEELCHWLLSRRAIAGSPARLTGQVTGIPDGLLGLLTARLDLLPPADKEWLKGASVLGRVFWEHLLAEGLGREAGESLERATGQSLVQLSRGSTLPGDRELTFRHALIREAAFSLVPKRERTRLHTRFADLLEARIPASGRPAKAMAAAQREAGGQTERAARLWLEAAREAIDEASPREGLALAESAVRTGGGAGARLAVSSAQVRLTLNEAGLRSLDLLLAEPGLDAAIRTEAMTLKSTVLQHFGEYERALEAVREAERAAPDPDSRSNSVLRRGLVLHAMGRLSEAEAVARALVDELAGPGSPPGPQTVRILASAVALLATSRWNLGEFRPAVEAARRSLELRRDAGDRGGIPRSLTLMGGMLSMLGNMEEGVTALEEAAAIQREIGDRAGLTSTLLLLGDARLRNRDLAGAALAAEEAGEIAQESRLLTGQSGRHLLESRVFLEDGKVERSLESARSAVAIAGHAGHRMDGFTGHASAACALETLGRTGEAAREARLALDGFRSIGHRWNELDMRELLSSLLADLDRRGEALAILDEGIDRASTWGIRAKEAALRLARHRLRSSDNAAAAREDALAALRLGEAMQSNPLIREALICLATASVLAGEQGEAARTAGRALELDAGATERGEEMKAGLENARLLAVLGRRDEVAAALQEAGRSALTAYPGPRAQLEAAAREAEDLLRRAESGKTRP